MRERRVWSVFLLTLVLVVPAAASPALAQDDGFGNNDQDQGFQVSEGCDFSLDGQQAADQDDQDDGDGGVFDGGTQAGNECTVTGDFFEFELNTSNSQVRNLTVTDERGQQFDEGDRILEWIDLGDGNATVEATGDRISITGADATVDFVDARFPGCSFTNVTNSATIALPDSARVEEVQQDTNQGGDTFQNTGTWAMFRVAFPGNDTEDDQAFGNGTQDGGFGDQNQDSDTDGDFFDTFEGHVLVVQGDVSEGQAQDQQNALEISDDAECLVTDTGDEFGGSFFEDGFGAVTFVDWNQTEHLVFELNPTANVTNLTMGDGTGQAGDDTGFNGNDQTQTGANASVEFNGTLTCQTCDQGNVTVFLFQIDGDDLPDNPEFQVWVDGETATEADGFEQLWEGDGNETGDDQDQTGDDQNQTGDDQAQGNQSQANGQANGQATAEYVTGDADATVHLAIAVPDLSQDMEFRVTAQSGADDGMDDGFGDGTGDGTDDGFGDGTGDDTDRTGNGDQGIEDGQGEQTPAPGAVALIAIVAGLALIVGARRRR